MALAPGPAITARAPIAASSLGDLGNRAGRVDRHGHASRAEHGEVRHDEVPVVGRQDADPVARLEAQLRQPGPEPRRLLAQLPVGRPAPARDQGDGVVRVRLDDRGEVHSCAVHHTPRHRLPIPRSRPGSAGGGERGARGAEPLAQRRVWLRHPRSTSLQRRPQAVPNKFGGARRRRATTTTLGEREGRSPSPSGGCGSAIPGAPVVSDGRRPSPPARSRSSASRPTTERGRRAAGRRRP